MTEINYILTTMTSQSLIIIDELCRSTSVEEGTAIAMAICESLASSRAYTYVTTHFTLLTKLADLFINIKVWQLQTIPAGDPNNPKSIKLDYKFNLIPGTTTLRGYGIYMVRNIWPEEVLKHVDELQGQLTKITNDPKFPSIDRRVRLRYDLECKLKKLKLQQKLTVGNLNKHIDDYNNEMAKIGENPHNSQLVLQGLPSAMEEQDAGLDHSIFDTSRIMTYTCPESDISKIYLKNIQGEENNNAFRSADQSQLSSIHFDSEECDDPDEIVLSPVSTYYSLQTPITSPSKAKQRMQEIFTPDTNLENFQTQSTYHSIDPSQNIEMFAPEVNLSCGTTECSLNLTKDALGLDEGHHSQIRNTVEDQPLKNIHKSVYEGTSQIHSEHEISRDISKHSRNIVSYGASQVSSCDLSQQLKMIREQRTDLDNPQEEFLHPPPPFPPELNSRYSETESPFTNTFMRPLQGDITKTSTPMITKIKHNARNFESSSTSTRTTFQNKTPMTTPKITFTILNQVEDVDMQSIQEDLESFVEDMQNDDFHCEEDVTTPKGLDHTNANITEKGSKQETIGKQQKITKSASSEENATRNIQKYQKLHIFPVVKVIEGPNDPSFDEENNNYSSSIEEGTVIRPVVRNLQVDNQEEGGDVDALIKAFNSLSEPKNPTISHIINVRECGNKILNPQRENTENNLEKLVKTFNSLSSPRKVGDDGNKITKAIKSNGQSHSSEDKQVTRHDILRKEDVTLASNNKKNTQQSNDSDNCLKLVENSDVTEDATFQSVNEIQFHESVSSNPNGNHNGGVLRKIVDYSTGSYESAISSPDISYSPLALSKKFALNDNNISPLQENMLRNIDDCEEKLESATEANRKVEKSKIQLIEKVEEVIELSDSEGLLDFQDERQDGADSANIAGNDGHHEGSETNTGRNKNTSNLSRFLTIENSHTQQINESFVTDYDKSTEIFLNVPHCSILEQEGTETEKVIQDNAETNNDEVRPRKNSEETKDKRKSKFYSDLSAESDIQSNHSETNPVEDLSKKSQVLNSNADTWQKNNSDNIRSCFSKDPSAESDKRSTSRDTTDDPNSKSKATNEEDASAANASSTYISATDVIQKIDEDALKITTFKIGQCEEALKKEKELIVKIIQMKNETKKKDAETRLSEVKPTPHISYLSAYSISSWDNSKKQSTTFCEDSFKKDFNSKSFRTRKTYSRRPTLGIPRGKPGSKNLRLKKVSEKKRAVNSNKENNKPKENTGKAKVSEDKNAEEGILENADETNERNNHEAGEIAPIEDVISDKNSAQKSPIHHGLKRRKLSQTEAESTSSLVHSTQPKIVEEKTMTSISEASKLRNLDGDFSSSSSGMRKCCLENVSRNQEDCEERSSNDHQEKTATTISEASRKRNLDSNSSDEGQPENNIEAADNKTHDSSQRTNGNQRKKFVKNKSKVQLVPREAKRFNSDKSSSSKTNGAAPQDQPQSKFIPPSKLSKKNIQEAFYEQDKKFFESSSGSSTELAKMWEQRLRRPSVKQIQRSTCVATLRKTEEGVEVIPTKEKKKRQKFKGKLLPSSSSSVNMNIFSDKNAETFDRFIKSDKKD